jgi:hypothetical protein
MSGTDVNTKEWNSAKLFFSPSRHGLVLPLGDVMLRFEYPTATVDVRTCGQIVTAAVGGLVTASAATKIIAGAGGWATQRLVQVVSYAEASVEMTPDVLFAAAVLAKPSTTPTALVVAPSQLSTFREYSLLYADRGVLKVAFTRMEEAQRWAARQAQVREYWARLVSARQAFP